MGRVRAVYHPGVHARRGGNEWELFVEGEEVGDGHLQAFSNSLQSFKRRGANPPFY